MYQRDYLLRMIEQFSVVLGKVIFQRRNQRFTEALELLAQAMKQLLGLNSKLVRALSAKDLISLLSSQGYFDTGKGLLLSDMLKAESEVLLENGQEADGWGCRLKSLELLLEINQLPEALDYKSDIKERMDELLPKVQHYRTSSRITELLMFYHSENGQLAKAEDMLFFLLEDDPDNEIFLEKGLQMVEKWLEYTAEELSAGNLTEEEIRAIYEILIKLKQNGS
ncbi:DUF6483 family protein [Paenibacillus radicis (ex Xue et al. 2023)]|uniref:DUF6483 family protein n=1 Tax=Paenibacillus radicis (ex Xue et al. 2023) TaxID=2972489 RepID=A0ABT1YTD6_9BACL|nr:DUF6483 family protein [Paenibacillus radicis (ex Xue et al. 2023)]MCR8636438.1 DUF6483 family protein [Paenibacillus radicis (ex Xue et al. 2023)]